MPTDPSWSPSRESRRILHPGTFHAHAVFSGAGPDVEIHDCSGYRLAALATRVLMRISALAESIRQVTISRQFTRRNTA
jgi:hypothetical protein